MSEEMKAKIHRVIDEAWNKGNVDALDELYAPNYVYHRFPFPDIEGLESYKQHIATVRNAYSDLLMTLDEIMLEGETGGGVARWTWTGTHSGQSPVLPFPPTGKSVKVVGCTVVHAEEGKYVEAWEYGDWLGMLQQLGVVPPLE